MGLGGPMLQLFGPFIHRRWVPTRLFSFSSAAVALCGERDLRFGILMALQGSVNYMSSISFLSLSRSSASASPPYTGFVCCSFPNRIAIFRALVSAQHQLALEFTARIEADCSYGSGRGKKMTRRSLDFPIEW